MEKISFLAILAESLRVSFSRAGFFLFGLLIALPLALQTFVFPASETATSEEFQAYIALHPLGVILFLLCYFAFTLYGKSNLIVALEQEARQTKETARTRFSLLASFKNFKKAVRIDLTIAGFFLLFFLILSLPSLLSFAVLGTVPKALLLLSAVTFLPVAILAFFIREFSFFYFLLTPLRLFSSFEAGIGLFVRRRFLCLLFGLFAILVSVLFTFFLNLVMLGTVALLERMAAPFSTAPLLFLISLACLTWYAILQQTLWLTFFRTLATPKETAPQETVTSPLETEENVPEIPTA